ncbi:hypothetical protein DFJ74DRAFT_773483 [Hyaloraphidium curvatum]|nr:hypothetical protein DFJ74DRAFT_773483 [Hyaloraphidium curvatum]
MPAADASSSSALDLVAPDFVPRETSWQRRPPQNPFGASFPLVLEAADLETLDSAVASVDARAAYFKELLKEHGAIYVTGLPLPTPAAFNSLVQAFNFAPFEYIGGAAPRTNVVGYVFTANEGPGNRVISWHNEISQSINPPLELVFYCEQAAERDGNTCINYGAEVLEALKSSLEPELVSQLQEKGFQYVRKLGAQTNPKIANGRGWRDTYNVKTQAECERVLASLNITNFRWLENAENSGEPSLLVHSPSFRWSRDDPRTGLTVFFNAACGAYVDHIHAPQQSSLSFGDGTPIPAETMERVIGVVDSVGVKIPWENGAILLVDNVLAQHARTTYEGTRKVYASLWK